MATTAVHVYGADTLWKQPMPAKTQRPKETWLDWMGPEAPQPAELLTREELLMQLRDEGFAVSWDNLRDWQQLGAIPYGVNRWHQGAVRTLYPPWMVNLLRSLRAMQADGHKLPEIRETLRRTAFWPVVIAPPVAMATGEGIAPTMHGLLPDALKANLLAFAHQHEQTFGGRITRAEVRLVDENGTPVAWRIDTRSE